MSDPNVSWEELYQELNMTNDRAAAVLGISMLDKLLQELITDQNSFASRIVKAHKLELISQEQKEDLTILKDIRNKFAHDLQFHTFDHQLISTQCRKMSLPKRFIYADSPPRELFISAVTMLIYSLTIQTLQAKPA
jgi:hypothetical protein